MIYLIHWALTILYLFPAEEGISTLLLIATTVAWLSRLVDIPSRWSVHKIKSTRLFDILTTMKVDNILTGHSEMRQTKNAMKKPSSLPEDLGRGRL